MQKTSASQSEANQQAKANRNMTAARASRVSIRLLWVTVNPTTTLAPWSGHDTQLLIACALGLAIIVIAIGVLKLAPFLSILVGTFAAGFAAHQPLEAIAQAFSKGAGALLGDVGIIIALGAMLGALMAESGAADRLVMTLLDHSTPKRLPWMMAFVRSSSACRSSSKSAP